MTQGLSLTILRKNNSDSTNINFRLNPNAHINSYVNIVFKHSQSTMKDIYGIDSMFQVCSQNLVCHLSEIRQNRGNNTAKRCIRKQE